MPAPMTVPMPAADHGLALYIHWPFCQSKCPYCDFNSHVRAGVDQDRWCRALLRELTESLGRAAADDPRRRLASIHFGGGTPSLMPPDGVAGLIASARSIMPGAADLEITLEANPGSVEAGRFAAYRRAGVNRLSLGIQSLDDRALRFLGRGHDRKGALAALAIAGAQFERVSFDLIYGLPGETPDRWQAQLEAALALAGDHLSLYQLTIEPGTDFQRRARRGETLTASAGVRADLYDLTQGIMQDAGFDAYEVSNHARRNGASRHNLRSWRYGDCLGIGPGAHGRMLRRGMIWATTRLRLPERWCRGVERRGSALAREQPLGAETRFAECLMMGLRLREGVPEARLRAASGRGFGALDPVRLADLRAEGLLTEEVGRLRTTADGRRRLDGVLGYLLA